MSQEILWLRVIDNAWQGRGVVFGTVVAAFLAGVALGAWQGRRASERGLSPAAWMGRAMVASGLAMWWLPALGSEVFAIHPAWGLLSLCVGTLVSAAMLGGVLPYSVHLGVSAQRGVAQGVSRIYLANILGSTAGPLLTGFVFLEVMGLVTNLLLAGALPMVLGLALLQSRDRGIAAALALPVLMFPLAYDGFLERLHWGTHGDFSQRYEKILENRSGNVTLQTNGVVAGNGVYDGRFNTDPLVTSNGILRAYLLPALQPSIKNVLMIGLGSGSWARVLSDYPELEKLTVVEINPAYVELVAAEAEVSRVLDHPKVEVVVDDGRGWLRQHPDAQFDVIVMNTSFHWRNHATNLLSREFMETCRNHLLRGGVLYFNTTSSQDAAFTAARVFPHIVQYVNFVAASDLPMNMSTHMRAKRIRAFERNGAPVFIDQAAFIPDTLKDIDLSDKGDALRKRTDLTVITADNLASEFKTTGPGPMWREMWEPLLSSIYDPERTWRVLLRGE